MSELGLIERKKRLFFDKFVMYNRDGKISAAVSFVLRFVFIYLE